MVLILHIRSTDMENCAFILMSSLPTTWLVVGCLLLILLLIVVLLYVLKAREVAALKKEVFELRDTMRMMRYEEISLSRMLHTASKYVGEVDEPVTREDGNLNESPSVEETEELEPLSAVQENVAAGAAVEAQTCDKMPEQVRAEDAVEEENIEEVDDVVAEATEEVSQEEPEETLEEESEDTPKEGLEEASEEVSDEELEEVPEAVEETIVTEIVEEEDTPVELVAEVLPEEVVPVMSEEDVPAQEEPVAPLQTGKQPIIERRPAIPTDLFSAWFAENEDVVENTTSASVEVTEEPIVATHPTENIPESAPLVREESVAPMEEEVASQEDTADLAVEGESVELDQDDTELSKEDERFCRKLERIVSTRMRNPNLNVDTIAAQFGIGRTNFYRKVRELTGMSPNDYLRKYRMERAAELLCTTDLPVSDVCVQVGVPDAQYFSKVFKVFFELTPTAYREKNQANQ